MPFARYREIFGSLRFRLTLWNSSIVFLVVILALLGVREALRLSLLHEADNQLTEDALEVRLTYEQLYPDLDQIYAELNRKAITHTHRGLYIRTFDEEYQPDFKSTNAPERLFPRDLQEFGQQPITFEHYRLVHLWTSRADIPRRLIRVGSSIAPLEADVAKLTRLMLTVGTIVLLISPLGGYWLAGRATTPLAQIIDTTARLHPSSLAERLPLVGTGDELDRLSLTINGLLDRIASYLNRNREFTSNAAHELRSPLAAIRSSIEVALNSDRTAEEYREMLGEIIEESTALETLVNQLLLLAETDSDRLSPGGVPVELDTMIAKSMDMFRGVAEFRGVELSLHPLPEAMIDGQPTRLRQVINNLLDNAIKFTPPGGKVDVRLETDANSPYVVLTVGDTGHGINADDLPHVFERFYRGDKARLREGAARGTGLGLSICQAIVEAHRGEIRVHSEPGRGTTFTVRFPVLAEADVSAPITSERPAVPSRSAS